MIQSVLIYEKIKDKLISYSAAGLFLSGGIFILSPLKTGGEALLPALSLSLGIYGLSTLLFKANLGLQKHHELIDTQGWNWAEKSKKVRIKTFQDFHDFIFNFNPLPELNSEEFAQTTDRQTYLEAKKKKYQELLSKPYPF